MANDFGIDAGSAYAAIGYMAGLRAAVETPAYLDSAVQYTHATLVNFFDEWMDALARSSPREFQHVYEWPTDFRQYEQTVGNPLMRLWRHTFSKTSGSAGTQRVASFSFLPSKTFVPVDPMLLIPNPRTGREVMEHVHIFELKAAAMEYGIDVTLVPKLAKYLAFPSGNVRPNFSKGPIHFAAGGNVTKGKFTAAYLEWWQVQAASHFLHDIAPVLERDVVNQTEMDAAIKMGSRTVRKNITIGISAEQDAATFAAAQFAAKKHMLSNQEKYINAAAARRDEQL